MYYQIYNLKISTGVRVIVTGFGIGPELLVTVFTYQNELLSMRENYDINCVKPE